jgi:hypothetical protein
MTEPREMYVPSTEAVLSSIHAAVRNDMLPELRSPWAIRQAETVLWALEYLRRRELVGANLIADEHRQLSGLVALTSDARTSFPAGQILAALQAPHLDGRAANQLPPAMLAAEMRHLRAFAEELAGAMASLECEPDGPLDPLRSAVLAYIQDQGRRQEDAL